MTASPAVLPALNTDALARDYHLRHAEEVVTFVNTHPFLLPLLREAPPHLRRVFGASVLLRLELSVDPEVPGSVQLFIIVPVAGEQELALQNLRVLDKGWWRTVFRQTQGKLAVDVEITDAL